MAGWRAALEALGLLAVLGFVAAVGYLPHADTADRAGEGSGLLELGKAYGRWLAVRSADDYEYTVHVDENVHWVAMATMERTGTLRPVDPVTGAHGEGSPLSLRGLVHERGFHAAVLMLQELTGVAWIDLFRFLPALWLMVTASLVWAALRPWAGALPAAALVALVPTSARFLGPGFLVPIGFGLAWVAAVLVLAPETARRGRGTALLLLVVAWAFFIHLIAGFAAVLLLGCALPFARGRRKGMAAIAAAAILPVVWLVQAFEADVTFEIQRIERLPLDFTIFDQAGIPFLVAWAVGCALVALRPPRQARLAVQAATLASAAGLGLIVVNLVLDLRLYALYDRWHQPFMLLAAVPVAHAVATAAGAAATVARRALRSPKLRSGRSPAVAAAAVGLLALVGVADTGVSGHLREPYYHVIEDQDWADYTWAAANVNGTYQVFLTHPWKAVVFQAMTGKEPHTFLTPGRPPIRGDDYVAYLNGRGDGPWLVERDISLVLDPRPPAGDGFEQAAPRAWLLPWDDARALAEARALARGAG